MADMAEVAAEVAAEEGRYTASEVLGAWWGDGASNVSAVTPFAELLDARAAGLLAWGSEMSDYGRVRVTVRTPEGARLAARCSAVSDRINHA